MSSPAATIATLDLQVGMFVHLDLSWVSHPFPLGSFRITRPEQIDTIRELGLSSVRWSPEKSELALTHPAGAGQAAGDDSPPPTAPEDLARQAHGEALSAQNAALLQCERQFVEASLEWDEAQHRVLEHPVAARERGEALTRALIDKMAPSRQLCIRVLTDAAGEGESRHALNVGVLSLLMGRAFGFSSVEMMDLGVGALMHDIGKLELPPRVRHADEGWGALEISRYREHVARGVSLGRKMGLSPGALLVLAQHHEHADGSGFPQRLNLERLSGAARIVALVNRYDNLCNPVHASRALTPHEALSLMFSQGKQTFDVTLLNAFIRMVGVYPPGSLVQLTDDRYAMVMTVNSSRPLKPVLLVHDVKAPREEALHLDLEVQPALGIRRSMKVAQLPAQTLQYLAPRRRVSYFFEAGPPREQPAAD